MIHLLVHALIIILRESTKASQEQRLRLPDSELFARNPPAFLARRDYVIGATYGKEVRWFPYAFVPCLIVAALVMAWAAWLHQVRNDNGGPYQLLMIIGVMTSFAGFLFLIPWIIVRWLPNKRIDMRRDGVRFWHGGGCVWCPWALFRVTEAMVLPMPTAIVLAVAPEAVPKVHLQYGMDVVDFGERAANGLLRFVSPHAIELTPVRGMELVELARLLYQGGRYL